MFHLCVDLVDKDGQGEHVSHEHVQNHLPSLVG
jgi:hypothetical protein